MSTSGGSGGGTQNAFPIANAAGVTIATLTDPVGAGMMRVVTLPGDQTAIAWQLAGDLFPRIIWPSDTTDGVFYVGDGTFDPYDAGAGLAYNNGLGFFVNGDNQQIVFAGTETSAFVSTIPNFAVTAAGDVTAQGVIFAGASMDIDNGDATFHAADTGPVVPDSTDGHTYRIITTAGVVGTEQVT